MALTDVAIRNAKPADRPLKLYDGGGLFLLVTPTGSRWWRFKYRVNGKEKLLSLGVYPEVSLKDAREARDVTRKVLKSGLDPAVHRKVQKAAASDRAANSFEVIAREWWAKHSPRWAESHSARILRRLEKEVFPWLGGRPVAEITVPELLTVLRRTESRGALETAHRVRRTCGEVFRYAVATGRAERDPAADLRGALPPARSGRFPAITDPAAIGALLRAIDGYQGSLVTRCALRLAPLVFVRPGELRRAEWGEIDLDAAMWRIPGERMKSRHEHIVPLSRQAADVLRELHPLTGRRRYVFPGVRSSDRPMSENTLNAALRRLGYEKDVMVAHGFRSMASTLLNEQGWHRDAIERQLAHAERDETRAAYHRAQYLDERRKMMQAWADYLDGLREGARVTPVRRVG
jgi:integrase